MRRLGRQPFGGEEDDVWNLELSLGKITSCNTDKCECDLLVQSHRGTWFGLDSHTPLPSEFCDVKVLSAQPNPFGAC